MDWLSFLTGEIAAGSILGILVATAITCWRAGSFHPVNARLLRFFISKDEIEDPIIKKNLADQAALVSFRITHGVHSRTLTDARKLAGFAEDKNVPIDLIGKAGWVFDLRKLVINPKRVPHKAWLFAAGAALVTLILAIAILCAAATKGDLLVTVKETGTWLWLSEDSARTVRPFFGKRETFDESSCSPDQSKIGAPDGFDQKDPKILCGIWEDSALESHLAKELKKQRRVLLMAVAVLVWYALMVFGMLRQWGAQIELSSLLREAEQNSSALDKVSVDK
jgi:hypothetical protein